MVEQTPSLTYLIKELFPLQPDKVERLQSTGDETKSAGHTETTQALPSIYHHGEHELTAQQGR